MFQIVEAQPIHCPIRDGIIGTSTRRLPGLLIHTEAWARRKAALLSQRECDEGGDGLFYVIPAGGRTITDRLPVAAAPPPDWDDMPF